MGLSRSRFSLARGMAASVLAHALPLICWLALESVWPLRPAERTLVLNLDFFGLKSDIRVEERNPTAPAPPVPALAETPAPVPAPAAASAPGPEPEPEKDPPLPESVPAERAAPPPARPRPAPARPRPALDGGTAGQVRRTLSRRELEDSLLRRYLTELGRKVRSRLVYPVKARAKGWTGVTTVAFTVTESGTLLPGTESVRKSSGYPELDEAALNAVRSAGSFPEPPKRMEVVISVSFREHKRGP